MVEGNSPVAVGGWWGVYIRQHDNTVNRNLWTSKQPHIQFNHVCNHGMQYPDSLDSWEQLYWVDITVDIAMSTCLDIACMKPLPLGY